MVTLYILLCTFLWGAFADRGPSERLRVVIGLDNVEEYYLAVRQYAADREKRDNVMRALLLGRSSPVNPRPKSENLGADVKERLCTQIFRSAVYRKMGLELPKPPYANVLTKLVGAFEYGLEFLTVHTPSKQYSEYVFPCYVKDSRTGQPRAYYISRAYDVNSDFEPISVGRFILLKGEDDLLTVIDMAEEAADLVAKEPSRLAQLFVHSREHDRETAYNIRAHNLCELDTNQRHQVCSSVLNACYFENTLDYYKPEESAARSCKHPSEEKFAVMIREAALEEYTVLEEAAIVCVVKLIDGGETLYLVTRGTEADNVFVYAHASTGIVRLLTLSKHIRNVFEWKLPVGDSTERERAVVPVGPEEVGTVKDAEDTDGATTNAHPSEIDAMAEEDKAREGESANPDGDGATH